MLAHFFLRQKNIALTGAILACASKTRFQHSLSRSHRQIFWFLEDIFELWLSECCLQDVHAHANPTDLFNSYRCFTEQMKEPTETDRAFRQRLKKAGFMRGSSSARGGRYWQGLKLRS